MQFLKDQMSFCTIMAMLKMLEVYKGQEDFLQASKVRTGLVASGISCL